MNSFARPGPRRRMASRFICPSPQPFRPEITRQRAKGYGAVRTAKDIVALGGLRVSEADRLDFGRLSHVEAVME